MNLRKWGLLLVPAACLGLAGCGLTGGSSDRVVYANYDDADGFCAQIKDAFANKAKADGIEVEFLDAKNDGNMQIDQLNEVISNGAGAIVLLAADGSSIVKTIEKANDAGIPVITVNRSVAGGNVLRAYSDDVEAGRMQGEYMAKNLPPNAKIVYLQGDRYSAPALTHTLKHSSDGIEGELGGSVTVRLTRPQAQDVVVSLKYTLDKAELKDALKVSAAEATIKAGQIASEPVTFTIDKSKLETKAESQTFKVSFSIDAVKSAPAGVQLSSNQNLYAVTQTCRTNHGTPIGA